jgi:hypothetical protein
VSALALLLGPASASARPMTPNPAVQPPTLTESFPSTWVAHGGTVTLRFTLNNPNSATETDFSSAGFSDNLPAGLVLGNPVNAGGTCLSQDQGQFSGSSGGHQLQLSNVSLPAGQSCSLSLNVVGQTSGRQKNTTGAPSGVYFFEGSQGGQTATGQPATANVIVLSPPMLHLNFAVPTTPVHGTTTLRFRLRNPALNPVALTGVGFSDSLPGNLRVASPSSAHNSCGGTWQGAAGSSMLQLSGGTIAPGSECTVTVDVTATSEGQVLDRAGPVSSENGGSGGSAQASMFVGQPPTISVGLKPSTVVSGHTARVTFTLTNPNHSARLNLLLFYVRLSKKLKVAGHPDVAGSCNGGTMTAVPGEGRMRFMNGQLPGGASCQLLVTIRAGGRGIKRVETTRISAAETVPGSRAIGELTVVAPHRH